MKRKTSTAVAPVAVSASDIATSLNQQYAEIQSSISDTVKRVLFFGAALAQAEIRLGELGELGNRKQGQGMAAWLAENCPTIKYKTAMRWKQIAVRAARSLGCDAQNGLAVLRGDFSACSPKLPIEELKSRVGELASADSIRELSQSLFDFASEAERAAVGRPAKSGGSAPALSAVESAERLWSEPLAIFERKRKAFYDSASLLSIDRAKLALSELRGLVDALKKRVKEG